MDPLIRTVRNYAAKHANRDGLATTFVPGLRMMCLTSSRGDLHSIYRPLLCLVLQGAKRMTVGRAERLVSAGQSVVVSADMPVVGRIMQASPDQPYVAVAVELGRTILREVATQSGRARAPAPAATRTVSAHDADPEATVQETVGGLGTISARSGNGDGAPVTRLPARTRQRRQADPAPGLRLTPAAISRMRPPALEPSGMWIWSAS
jgi:hypothetical protein